MPLDTAKILSDIEVLLEDGEKIQSSESFLSGGKRKQTPRMYVFVHTTKRDLFVKSATDPISREGFRKEHEALSKLRLKDFQIPHPLGIFDWGIVMSKLEGVPLDEKIRKQKDSSEMHSLLKQAVLRIASFHSDSRKKTPTAASLKKIYREATGKDISSESTSLLAQANFGFSHGDLDPFNLLVTDVAVENKFALIDWEDFKEDGAQEFDIIHFVIMLAVIINPGVSYDELYDVVFKSGSFYMDLLRIYSDERGISSNVVQQLVPMYCDVQNFRLIKANRSVEDFLYNTFKERFYES